MTAQLQSLATQSIQMTAALEAAQSRIAIDTQHAKDLAKQLKDAKKKLAKLEKSIAKAKQATHHTVVVTKTKTVSSPAPKSHGDDGGGDDDEGGDD